jgi:type II secretory pathway component PulJ
MANLLIAPALNRPAPRRARLDTRTRRTGEEGFSLIETVTALSLLAVGLLSLAGVYTTALSRMTTSTWDVIAKEKASGTIENILAARDAGRLSYAQINNVGTGTGIFVTGKQRLLDPGPDRLNGTADDLTDTPEVVRRPGTNGNLGDSDDEIIQLSLFKREIVVQSVPPGDTLREIRVTIRYSVGGIERTVRMSSYVSSFTG